MAVQTISKSVMEQVLARLTNATTGYNATLGAQLSTYNFPDDAWGRIDFTSEDTKQFVQAQIDPIKFEQSGYIKYPWACLYIQDSACTNIQKFNKFSGPVRCVFEVYIAHKKITGHKIKFDEYMQCIEDVVVDVMNREVNQNWTGNAVYNGNVKTQRSPVDFGATNWVQRIAFQFIFEIHRA